MIVLWIFEAVEAAVLIWILALILRRNAERREKENEKRADEAVEREMKRDFMDEGFENIMSYSVNGRNGFDDDK